MKARLQFRILQMHWKEEERVQCIKLYVYSHIHAVKKHNNLSDSITV